MWRRLTALLAAAALLVAACGGSDDGTGIATLEQEDETLALDEGGVVVGDPGTATPTTGDEDLDLEAAMLAYTECMREEGIEMEDPVMDDEGNLRLSRPQRVAEGDFDREVMEAAREACAALFEGLTQQFEQPDETELQDQLLAYAACMRENGFDMADPDLSSFEPGGGGGGRFGISSENRDDPVFQEANAACQDLFTGGFGPGGGPGGPGR